VWRGVERIEEDGALLLCTVAVACGSPGAGVACSVNVVCRVCGPGLWRPAGVWRLAWVGPYPPARLASRRPRAPLPRCGPGPSGPGGGGGGVWRAIRGSAAARTHISAQTLICFLYSCIFVILGFVRTYTLHHT
jgi:hypothetical protein